MNESFHYINRLRESIAFFEDDDRSEFMIGKSHNYYG